MNLHLILGYPLFALAVLDTFLAFLLLKNNPQNKNINKAVAIVCFTMAAYAVFVGIIYIQEWLGLNFDLFYKACWIGWIAIPPAAQCAYYIKDDKSHKAFVIGLILYTFWLIVYLLCFTTNWVETGVNSLIPFIPRYGIFERPIRLIGAAIIVWIFYKLFRTGKEVTGIKKIQINYLTLGLTIYGIGGFLPSGILQLLPSGILQLFGGFGFEPGLTVYYSLPFTLLTYYAITRYRLFDIQIIISNSLTILILTVVLGSINIALFKLLEPPLGSTWAILISLVVIITIFLRTPLRRTVQGGINDIFLGDKYNYQSMLRESTQAIVAILDQDELLNYLVHTIQQGFKIHKACLFLKHAEGPYCVRYHWGMDKTPVNLQLSEDDIIEWLKKTKQIFIKEEQQGLLSQEQFRRLYGKLDAIEAHLILPLFFKDNLIGFFTFGPKGDDHPYVQSDIDILQTLGGQAAIAIENARLYSEAITDSLTGLYHHKYFMMRLQEEMERAKRYQRGLSLLMLDIDHFKSINDVCGHLAGDKVLVGLANLIKKNGRGVDVVARYGGEEFAVILPDTNQEGALTMAKRLRERAESTAFDGNLKITVSIGVASLEPPLKKIEPEDLVAAADKALYQAKKNGRNRIETAESAEGGSC